MTTRVRARTLALAIAFLAVLPAFAAGPLLPYLVEDLTPGERSESQQLGPWGWALGEVVFFSVAGEQHGIWRTDGTAAGTHRVYDGLSDPHFEVAHLPAIWNGSLYYPVATSTGTWLYRTDGTTPGTAAAAKISQWFGGAPCGEGKLCFGTQGSRIAVTDGTPEGTRELLSTAPGYETDLGREMTSMGGRVYFNAYDDKNGLCMIVPAGLDVRQVCGELWTSDGTVAGTRIVRDILPGGLPGAPEHLFASSAGKLYFAAADPARPRTPAAWVSDGTAEGTRMLVSNNVDWELTPTFVEFAGRVFFRSGDDTFETDGTLEGTRSIRHRFATVPFVVRPVGEVNGLVLLIADYREASPELWSWDGTTLRKLADIPDSFRPLGFLQSTGLSWFVTDDGRMWSTDGTAAGTRQRFSVPASTATMFPVAVTPTRLYYGEGYNRYVTDGTEAGTRQINLDLHLPNNTPVEKGKVLNGKYFFQGAGMLGTSDGTAAGTTILLGERASEPFEHEGHTWFFQDTTLWTTDGTVEGTFPAGKWLGVERPLPPAFIGSQAIFGEFVPSGRLLRRDADGTLHHLGVRSDRFESFTGVAGGVAFWAGSPPRLMFTDGTVAGTRTVSAEFQSGGNLIPLGAKAVFGATKPGATTLSLWVTDFTAAGTRALKELPGATTGKQVVPLLTWRNLSIFTVRLAPAAIWRSDGTLEGTFPLVAGSFDAVLADGDELVLVRFTHPAGYEVWTSDGTAAGTQRRDVYSEGTRAGDPFVMSGGGVGVLYSPRADEIHIRNHRTRTVQVIDWSGLRGFLSATGHGDLVFFPGYRRSSGRELWAVRLDGTAPSPPASVRIAYVGLAKTASGLGAVFRVEIAAAAGVKLPSVIATTADGTLTSGRDYVPFTREIVFERDHEATLVVPLRDANARGTLSVVLSAPVNATIMQGMATAQVGGSARRRSVRK
jgi:ELWxxDGT repeat protein